MKKTIYKQLLILFFAIMLLFTILSRMIDAMMIAKVRTGNAQRKNINCVIEGEAFFESGDIELITSEEGYRIERVSVMVGSKITPDMELFRYQTESIRETRNDMQADIDKLLLEVEQSQLSAQNIPSVSEADVSQLQVQVAEKSLYLAQAKYDEKQFKYQENIQYLDDKYQKKKNLTEDELRYQYERSYRTSEQNYNTAKVSRNKEIKNAERKVEDVEKELNRLENEEADDDLLSEAQKKLDRAQEDLDDLKHQWEDTVDSAKEQMSIDDEQINNIGNDWTSAQLMLEEEYRLNLEKEEQTLQSAEDELENEKRNLELSKKNLVLSQTKDRAVQAENSKQKQIAELTQKSLQIDIENKKMKIAAIDNLLMQNGIVKADLSGTVVKTGIEIGQITSGKEMILIATGNFRIRGKFQKDGDISILTGNNVTISVGGKNVNATVDVVDLSHDKQGEFTANADFKDAAVGMAAQYKYTETSDIYDKVIPLGAIHKDVKGYYCLTVQENNGILGAEFTAARVDLEVVFSGTNYAAVEGNLGHDTHIIMETDKVIQEGERIRLVDNYAKN